MFSDSFWNFIVTGILITVNYYKNDSFIVGTIVQDFLLLLSWKVKVYKNLVYRHWNLERVFIPINAVLCFS